MQLKAWHATYAENHKILFYAPAQISKKDKSI